MKRLLTLSALAISSWAAAQNWDVSNPPGNYKEVEFTVNEGTWMNLDLSPDGKTLVFDLLGDIYSMPSGGGEAKLLRGGLPFEVQPRFSPDGKQILFTSDAGGGDNIWVMNADGSEAKQITREDFRLLNNPVWSPEGDYFVARKHFTSGRSLGAGELWLYHKTGGSGIQITKRKNDQQDLNEPAFSPDGRYIYYSEDLYPGGYFQYNKDPNSLIYGIRRYDRYTGEIKTIISGNGGAVRPAPSPDGKYLAYVRRVRTKTVLYLHELETGIEFPVCDKLSKDQQEAWAIFGVYTGYAWSPDAKQIYIWANGKINRLDVATKVLAEVPFTVKAKHRIRHAVKHRQEVAPEKFDAKMIRHAVTSPDGKTLIFSAVGYLWKKTLPDGTPERLTKQSAEFEFEPAFSPNGQELVFVTWSDSATGAIVKYNLKTKKGIKITSKKGIYRTPSFSADGKKLVFWKEYGNDHQGFAYAKDAGIYVADINGANQRRVKETGGTPAFNQKGDRIYFAWGNDYKSMDLNGQDERTLVSSTYAGRYTVSPDNQWIAFTDLHKVYVARFPQVGKTIDLSGQGKNVPVAQFAKDAGINLHWSADSKELRWTQGETYYSKKLNERFLFLEGSADTLVPLSNEGIRIGLTLPTATPQKTYVLNKARIITADRANKVIENGYLVVSKNHIVEMGEGAFEQSGSKIRVDEVIDCAGKTLMPGLVDVHAHLWTFREGIHPQQYWPYYANLAYGVTTTHDPSSNTEMVFTQSEMVKYGSMIGPRIYSTGTILYGAEGDFKAVINNYDDARSAVARTQAFGAFSVKSYNQPRREQRQQVITAADSLGVMVYPEGGSFFYHNLTMILDGHTGVEHNLPVAPLYDDVIKLWAASETGYTPTLIVCYGAVSGEYYWYQKTNVWEKERLMRFTPRSIVDSRSRHRIMIPDEEYENGHILVSKSCKKLTDAGVKLNLGSHGQLEGLGAHWELWMLAQGGMTPMEVIRAGTIHGAEYIGMGDQIGSLETGKLADILILDANPLENIYHTEKISRVIVNGKMYEAETLQAYDDKKTPKFWFENELYDEIFPWNEQSGGFSVPKCHCGKH